MCLDFLLKELRNYPNMGEHLVQTALNSPVIRERNGACAVMEEWVKKLEKPLQIISPALYATVCDVALIEVNVETKKNMDKLIKI